MCQMKTCTVRDASVTSLPTSLTFSRRGPSNSNIFQCDVNWVKHEGNACHRERDPRRIYQDQQGRSPRRKWYEDSPNELISTSGAILDNRCCAPVVKWIGDNSQKSLARTLQHHSSPSYVLPSNDTTTHPDRDLPPQSFSPYAPRIVSHRMRQNPKELLSPINLLSPICNPDIADQSPSTESPSAQHDLFSASSLRIHKHGSHQGIACHNDLGAFDLAPHWCQQSSRCIKKPSAQRSLHKTLGSRKLRHEAESGTLEAQQPVRLDDKAQSLSKHPSDCGGGPYDQPVKPPRRPRLWIDASSSEESVEHAQVTTMLSPSKARLITITPRTPSSKTSSPTDRPALVSAFSPDTPSETPHVTNRNNEVNDIPTSPPGNEHVAAGLDTELDCPITPPSSIISTPCDEINSSACLRKHSRWVPSTMTQLDPLIAWILQELEVLLADFPRTTLRVNSPVIDGIRSSTLTPAISERPARNRSSTAPHSRYSLFRPVTYKIVGVQSPIERDPTPQSHRALRNTVPSQAALALRAVFPNARPHHLDSLHATFIALHFIIHFPSLKHISAPASDAAVSPDTASPKHSRSSSVASNIPAKARAMLGMDSPIPLSPLSPSPAKSWFRVSTPELDPEVKMRLENVEILLESSIRKILVEIEGRPLGKQDDALVRAVGEVIKLSEHRAR